MHPLCFFVKISVSAVLLHQCDRAAGKEAKIAGTGNDVDIAAGDEDFLCNHSAVDIDVAGVNINGAVWRIQCAINLQVRRREIDIPVHGIQANSGA